MYANMPALLTLITNILLAYTLTFLWATSTVHLVPKLLQQPTVIESEG